MYIQRKHWYLIIVIGLVKADDTIGTGIGTGSIMLVVNSFNGVVVVVVVVDDNDDDSNRRIHGGYDDD